jgi:predicted metalloprotease with PDZ domain
MFRGFASLLLVLCCALSLAEISYKVTPDAGQGRLNVEITIPVRAATVELQMPNWAPGSYRLVDYFAGVKELRAVDGSGTEITATKPNDYTWSFAAPKQSLKVTYWLSSQVNDGAMHYSGPSTYLYVVGRKEEPCTLEVALPSGWKIASGLDEDGAPHKFKAPNYDVLADNPVSMGNLLIDTYTVRGKPHYIVMRGAAKSDVDRQYLLKACKHVTEAQADFFGGLPYSKYVWHFSVNDALDGAGGLEHLSSTQISLPSGVGPRAVSVISHEFFHLWNVKRIRSKPLGPFDYTKLPKTGALWWLEGTTDYYAHLLLYRYGWWGEDMWHKDIIDNLAGVRANPARMEVSPHDASMRVGEAANGRGNSNGYRVSYYNTGFLVGLCLDTELRHVTGGRRSLDDVMRALWALNKDDKPGFEEDEIRKQLVRFGGQSMGAFYDRVVMQPGELPIETQLEKMGLSLAQGDLKRTDTGIAWFAVRGEGARVRSATGSAKDRLLANDTIVSIDGQNLKLPSLRAVSAAMQAALAKARPGTTLTLRVMRGEGELDVDLIPVETTQKGWVITKTADAQKAKLRDGWYFTAKRPFTAR